MFIYESVYVFIYESVYVFFYESVYVFFYESVYVFFYESVYVFFYESLYVFFYESVYVSDARVRMYVFIIVFEIFLFLSFFWDIPIVKLVACMWESKRESCHS